MAPRAPLIAAAKPTAQSDALRAVGPGLYLPEPVAGGESEQKIDGLAHPSGPSPGHPDRAG